VAPKADNVAVLPTQIAVVLKAAVTVGFATTIKLTVALPIHPKAVVPDTEYVVVTVGDTLTGDPINPPGFQV
jgi:predicted metal-dependent TIM-barrel fold hydrolase